MTLRMQGRSTRWGDFSDIDLPAIGAGRFRLALSYTHPAQLEWECLVPQHQMPLPLGLFIRLWIDGVNDPAGEPFSASNPIFEGYIEQAEPGNESIGMTYTALDPTYRATKMVTIFNVAWPAGTVPDTPPIPPENGVPRLIYNCRISADPDWAYQVGADGTIGNVIAGCLQFTYFPLVWCDAAPGNGTDIETPYLQDEIDAITVKPQEKLDFQSESVRSAIDRMQRYDPRVRLAWEPGTRLWRLHNITNAPTKTLRLNRGSEAFPVLSMQLKRSTEQCVTAVTIYGPEESERRDFVWYDTQDPYGDRPADLPANTLQPLGDPIVMQNFSTAGGMFDARLWPAYQIIEANYRRGAQRLPQVEQYQRTPFMIGQTEFPVLLCSWDWGATWLEWYRCWNNTLEGTVTFDGLPPMFYKQNGSGGSITPGSTQTCFLPNALKLVWSPFTAPLKVRRPETGWEGTAFTQAGVMVDDYQYDEALSIGREFGQPVTSAARRAAYGVYAQSLLDQRKDVVWTGGALLDGLDWDYCRLNKRCQIIAEDGSSNELETDFADVRAYVTDVEYDLEEQTTQLTFSADKLALFGIDEGQLKQALRIRQLDQSIEYRTSRIFGNRQLPNGKTVQEVIGVQTQTVFHYTDPGA